jgi:lipid-A-disaccharide synthase
MKYYLIAGERAGDLHGANLIRQLQKEDPEARFRAWGGEHMQEAGAQIVVHYTEMAVMGFAELLGSFFKILGFLKKCRRDIQHDQPDVIILIDFAGFNLRIARFAKKKGYKVYYYISPKIWAWGQKRAYKIRDYVDKMFVILPFEQQFYKKFGVETVYIGNPVQDAVRAFEPSLDFFERHKLDSKKKLIALLPGSRKQEVKLSLPEMAALAKAHPEWQFGLSVINNLPETLYEPARGIPNITMISEDNYNLLYRAHTAVVTSGTATLETALFHVPQVVVYKTSPFNYHIGMLLVKVEYISLVNLIADEEVVRELLQADFTMANLKKAFKEIAVNGAARQKVLEGYKKVSGILKNENASQNAAKLMWQYLNQND